MDSRDPANLFDIEGSLGEGSYGAVWQAVEKSSGKNVAIKIIPIDDDDEMAELMKEIEILQVCRDEFVVNFHGAFQKDRNIWIVMEICQAGSANDLMHICEQTFTESEIKEVCASVLLGLNYLHSNRIVHRDIKAGNILLTKGGQAKLADFGVSAQLTNLQSKRRTVIGTPFWMAPEVIQEQSYDGKADIWSLGITLIELAESEPPYSNIHPMRAIFMIPSRPPPQLTNPENWSDDMSDFLSKCLTKNPDKRPTAEELLRHPFVKGSVRRLNNARPRGHSDLLRRLVNRWLPMIEEFRETEANRQQEITVVADQNTAAMRGRTAVWLDPTLPKGGLASNTMLRTMASTGTMVQADGTVKVNGTMVTSQATGTEPSFMAYFQSPTATAHPAKPPAAPTDNVDMHSPELNELRGRLLNLEKQFRTDIVELRRAYMKRRNALVAAASGNR